MVAANARWYLKGTTALLGFDIENQNLSSPRFFFDSTDYRYRPFSPRIELEFTVIRRNSLRSVFHGNSFKPQ